MTPAPELPPPMRVALVDLSLADCDRLRQRVGRRAEVALVVAPAEGSPLARWAEAAGYPRSTNLQNLSATVVDGILVSAASPRRQETMSMAALLGARLAIVGDQAPASSGTDGHPHPGLAWPEASGLDEALDSLFRNSGAES